MNMLGIPAVLLALLLAVDDKPAPKPADIDYEAKLNELLSKGIAPETNANVLIWKALGPTPEGGTGMPPEYFKRLGIPEPSKEGVYFVGIDKFVKEQLKLPQDDLTAIWAEQGWATKQPWAAKDYPHIAAWLKANEKPLAVVIEATKRPHYYNPIIAIRSEKGERGMLIGSLLPNVQKGRELVAALAARAMLRIEEGKPDEAWQDILAAHRLGRLTTHGGTLIQSLVGIAIGAIANNATLAYLDRVKLTPKQLADRMKELEALPPRQTMADTIDLGERNMGLDSLQHIRRGGGGALGNIIPGNQKPNAEDLKALAMLDWDTAFQVVTSSYDKMSSAMRVRDRAAREKAFDKLETDLEAQAREAKKNKEVLLKQPAAKGVGKIVATEIANTLMGLLAPAVRKVQSAYDRADQLDRNLQVAFALAAYRADAGRYPAKLDDLAPKYLAAVPNDIFTGKPLIYKPTEKGYLFYSVGANGKDEDGRWYDDEPAGDDPRVRMPLPPLKKDK